MKNCRICYSNDQLDDICCCNGSIKYICNNCINYYIYKLNKLNCDLCNKPFNLRNRLTIPQILYVQYMVLINKYPIIINIWFYIFIIHFITINYMLYDLFHLKYHTL